MNPITEQERNSVKLSALGNGIRVEHLDEITERIEKASVFPIHAMACFVTEGTDGKHKMMSFDFKSSAEAEVLAKAFADMAEFMKSKGL